MKARRCRDGIFEYLAVWEPKSNGDPWDDTWEPENYITEELKESFKSTLALSKQVRVDVAPLLTFVRRLTKEDIRLAEKWGISLDKYAAEKLKVEKADGEYTTVYS